MALLPKVKLKAVVSFPAAAFGGSGIAVRKQDGNFYFDLAFDEFPPVTGIPPADIPNTYILALNQITKVYTLVPIATSGVGLADTPADGLIYNRTNGAWVRNAIKIVSFTRVMSLASGNQSITSVGFRPRFIQFQTGISGGSGWGSFGQSDGVSNSCNEVSVTVPAVFPQNFAAGIQRQDAAGANYNTFTTVSFDADGFTVAWTKVGAPTATVTVTATCYA